MRYIQEMTEILRPFKLEGHTDFKHDKALIDQFDSPRGRWLWVVNSCGTTMVRLGVSKKESSWAKAALNADRTALAYLLEDGSVRAISNEVAKALINSFEYEVRGGHVCYGRQLLATFVLNMQTPTYRDPEYRVKVTFLPLQELNLDQLVALWYLAIEMAIEKAGTFFVKISEIDVDSTPLLERIEALKNREVLLQAA